MSQKRRKELRKCRLCLCDGCDDKHLIYLFEASGVFTDTAKAIMEVLQYEVFKDDRFPPYICIACSDKLWEFKAFKEKCDNAKDSFESFLSKIEEPLNNYEEPLSLDIVKEEPLEDYTSSSTNDGDAVNTRLQAEEAKIGPMQFKEEFGIFETENQKTDDGSILNDDLVTDKLVSCIKKEDEEITENFQIFAESVVAVKLDEVEDVDCYDEITMSHLKIEFQDEDSKEEVSSRVLRPRGRKSYQLSQSDSENSQTDQSSYQVSPDEMSSSDVQENVTIERNVRCKTGKKGSVYSLMEESNPLASTSSEVVSGLSEGLKAAESSSNDSLQVQLSVPKEENEIDPIQSGNRITTAKEEKLFLCEICGKKLKSNRNLIQHMLGVHSSRELYKCEVCNKAFKTRNSLYHHSNYHRETPRFRCSKCGKGFQKKQRFTDHLRRHGVKLFPCVHCSVDCRNKEQLEEHYPVHDEKVDWACDGCGGKYRKWSDLVTHRRTHQVKMMFKCVTCGSEYTSKDTLRRHTYIHTRPLSCPTCSKTFPTKYDLLKHSYTHSGIRPYKCQICGQRFHQKGHLPEHIKTHSEERPFPCQLCSYRAKTEIGLKRHVYNHSTSVHHKCNFCDRTYVRNRDRRRHERKAHGDKIGK